jgi:hypothetical protein
VVLVAIGADGHVTDPLSSLQYSYEGYAEAARTIGAMAARHGRRSYGRCRRLPAAHAHAGGVGDLRGRDDGGITSITEGRSPAEGAMASSWPFTNRGKPPTQSLAGPPYREEATCCTRTTSSTPSAPTWSGGLAIGKPAHAHQHGDDIVAVRGDERLVVEAKGAGSSKAGTAATDWPSTAVR